MPKLLFHGAPRLLVFIIITIASLTARSQGAADGREHPLQDKFLDGLVGDWHVERVMQKRTAENTVKAEWVLNRY